MSEIADTPPAVPEDDDRHPSIREKCASRAYRMLFFSLAAPVLLPVWYWSMWRLARAPGRLEGQARRQAFLAALAAVLLPVVVGIVVFFALRSARPDIDLRDFPHPRELVGSWSGSLMLPEGELVKLVLQGDSAMRAEAVEGKDARPVVFSGSWGYTNHALYLHIVQVKGGLAELHGEILGWNVERCTHLEIIFAGGDVRLRRQ